MLTPSLISRRNATLVIATAIAVVSQHSKRAVAQSASVGQIEVIEPYVRAMPSAAKVGAGYAKIRNAGEQPDKLLAVETTVARSVEIHSMTHDGGVMKMRQVEGGLSLPPRSTIELGPSALHLMFMEPRAPFKVGETVKTTLVFEKAGSLEVTFAVKPMGAR